MPAKKSRRSKRLRSEGYLRHVREYPCLSCELTNQSVAHHVQYAEGHKAMALKVGDNWTVPLCTPCHTDLHRHQESLWWALKGIDPIEWCKQTYERWKNV